MKASVIVCTRNRAVLLAQALSSVMGQTFGDFEIVAVDDASTDGTGDVLAAFAGQGLRVVRHRKRRGYVAAMNGGLAAARGEYVAFLDDDDLWLPEKLERQVEALDAAGPDVGWVYTWRELFDDATGRVLRTVGKTMAGDILDDVLALDWPGPPSTWLMRASALREIGGFRIPPGTRSPRSSDVDVVRRLCLRGVRVAAVPEVLVRKRVHEGQMTADLDAAAVFHRAHLARFAAELAERPRALAQVRLRLGWIELRRGRAGAASRLALAAFRHCPRGAAAFAVRNRWIVGPLMRRLLGAGRAGGRDRVPSGKSPAKARN